MPDPGMPDSRALLHQETSGQQLELHPAWPRLTADQRQAVNEVWGDMVVPALEEVDAMRRRMEVLQLEAQDARGLVRRVHEESERRADRERAKRQELLKRIAQLETRALELEGMELPHAA